MKFLFRLTFILLVIGIISASCNDGYSPTEANDDAIYSLDKVEIEKDLYDDIDLSTFDPTLQCSVGELLQLNGIVRTFWDQKTTPSGNTITKGWTDFFYFPEKPVYYEGLTSGEKWYLYKVSNPNHEVIKENGFYKLKYTSHEYYRNEITGQEFRFLVQGIYGFDKNGTEYSREVNKCK